MAFCNSCGASLEPGTKFCNKCGATVSGAAAGAAAAPAAAPPPVTQGGGSGVLKVILIVVGVFVILGVLAVSTVAFIGWRVAHNLHVRQDGNHVKVETPFGSVESSKNPEDAARDLGVDIYPGALAEKNGAATATFGGMRTASATFKSGDSVDQVSAFYKAKFPNAMVTTSDQNRCTIIAEDQKNMTTINIQGENGQTKIQITHVTHNADATSSGARSN
ncbi:MAG: zinc ribbon domain-containing protein [Candidatus Sulfotelmatobacter sp.]